MSTPEGSLNTWLTGRASILSRSALFLLFHTKNAPMVIFGDWANVRSPASLNLHMKSWYAFWLNGRRASGGNKSSASGQELVFDGTAMSLGW